MGAVGGLRGLDKGYYIKNYKTYNFYQTAIHCKLLLKFLNFETSIPDNNETEKYEKTS